MKILYTLLMFLSLAFLQVYSQSVSELDAELDSLIFKAKGKSRVFYPEQALTLKASTIDEMSSDGLIGKNLTFVFGKTEVKFRENEQYRVFITTIDKNSTISSSEEISEVLKVERLNNKDGKYEVFMKLSQIVKLKLDDLQNKTSNFERLKQIVSYILQGQTLIN